MALIEINNAKESNACGEDAVEALGGVNLSIEAGACIGARLLRQGYPAVRTGGMNRPTRGEVTMAGEKRAPSRAQNLGFVFQSFHLSAPPWPS